MYRESGILPIGAYYSNQGEQIYSGAGAYYSNQGETIYAGAGETESKGSSFLVNLLIYGALGVAVWYFISKDGEAKEAPAYSYSPRGIPREKLLSDIRSTRVRAYQAQDKYGVYSEQAADAWNRNKAAVRRAQNSGKVTRAEIEEEEA